MAGVTIAAAVFYSVLRGLLASYQENTKDITYQRFREEMLDKYFEQPLYDISHTPSAMLRETLETDLKKVSDYYSVVVPTILLNTVFIVIVLILFAGTSFLLAVIFFFLFFR